MTEQELAAVADAARAWPLVEIELGGKKYFLKYNMRAMIRFHEATGINPLETNVWATINPRLLVALLHAGMQNKHNESGSIPSEDDLIDLIDMRDMSTLIPTVVRAMNKAEPAKDEKKSSSEQAEGISNPQPSEPGATESSLPTLSQTLSVGSDSSQPA